MVNTAHPILFVGDPEDFAFQQMETLCRESGTPTMDFFCGLGLAESYETVILFQRPEKVLAQQSVHRAVYWLETHQEKVSPEGLILVCSWTLTPTELAAAHHHPERVVGFSPMGLYTGQKGIELAPALQTSEATREAATTFIRNLGLTPMWIEETPGMILPRILAMLVNEATSALMEGVATAEDIDTAMKLGTNYPLGPLAWADVVGLDVVYEILNHLYQEYGEDRYRPMRLLRQKVLAGQLGQKAGQGFYTYTTVSVGV